MADERDWYRVVAVERCPEFHLSARDIRRDALGSALLESAEAWSRVLAAPTRALRRSPARRTWSALEYGAHVRDVLGLFAGRIDRALAEDEPEFEWWDHEEAVLAERYNGQDPAMVARQASQQR